MALQLGLHKEGDKVTKLKLNLSKGARFRILLRWDSEHDLDGHALLAVNSGGGAKVTAMEQILSTYNVTANNPQGALSKNPDGSFNTPDGALHHSGDSRTGVDSDVDETITVDTSKIAAGVNEIPIVVTIHEAAKTNANFGKVKAAGICIQDDNGATIAEYELSREFGKFNAIQMGAVCLGEHGWEFAPIGAGFNGDFNVVLGNFS